MAFQPHRPYGQTTRMEPIYPGIPFSDHKPLPLMSLGNPRLIRMTSQPLSGQFPADRGVFNQEGVHPVGGPRTFLPTRVPRPRAFQPRVHEPSTSHIRPEMVFTKYVKDEDKVDMHTFHDTSKLLEKSHKFAVKAETNDSNKESAENVNITMDSYDRDLHFDVDSSGLTAWTLHKDGFEYLWGGARASHGIRSGKVAFECAIIEALPVVVPPTERNPHVARVGWSVDSSDFQLGEDKLSYGYGGTGKISLDSKFSDYGRPFSVGDVVTCLLDLDSCPKTMSFMVNGENFGVAFKIGLELGDRVLYPHVTSKNMKFTMNFGGHWPQYPLPHGFCLLQNVLPKNLIKAPSGPPMRKDAEFIMMVGLPACGKTVWAKKYCKDHPEKKYYMLGTNNIIEKMRIMGLSRKGNYHGRWDALIKQATGCLNVWLKIAEKRIANYILDQTNVYFSARRRKMRNFTGYKRIACVIVNNRQVLEERTTKREMEEGKFVPAEAVMEMKANLSLPEVGESFDEVRYIEERPPIALAIVNSFKAEGEAFKRGTKRILNQDSHANAKVPRTDFQNEFQKNTRSGENGPNQRGTSSVEPSWEDSNRIHSYNQGIRDEYYQRDGIRNHNDRVGARPSYPTNDRRQPFGSREGQRKSYEERYQPINQFAERGFSKPSYFDRYTRQQPYEGRNARPPYADMGISRHNFANRDITTQPYVATDTTRLSYGGKDMASVGNIPEENFGYRNFHTVVKEEPRSRLTERRYESSVLLSSSEASRSKEYANASYGAGNHSTETIYQGSTQSYSPVGESTKDDQFRRQDHQDSYLMYNQQNYEDQRRGGQAARDCNVAGANNTIDPRQSFGATPSQAGQHYRHRIKEEPKDDWPDHYSQSYPFS